MIRSPVLFILLLAAVPLFAQDIEDILILKDGTIVRGTVLERIPERSVRIRTRSGEVKIVPMAAILKQVSAKTSVPDSSLQTLVPTILEPPGIVEPEDRRMLTLFGGAGLPMGDRAGTRYSGAEALDAGFVLGADAAVRLGSSVRVLLSGMKGWFPTELSNLATESGATAKPATSSLWYILGGLQYCAGGHARVKYQGEVLLGSMTLDRGASDLMAGGKPSIAIQQAISSSGFAYALGIGARMDRFTLIARMVIGSLRYWPTIGNAGAIVNQKSMLILFALGYEVL